MLHSARTLVLLSLLLAPLLSWAQSTYSVLIDSDNLDTTGCDIASPFAINGIERRLTASVDLTTLMVTDVTLAECIDPATDTFSAATSLPGTPYPIGLNNGLNGADVIELAVAVNAIAPPGQEIRLYFISQSGAAADLLPDAATPITLRLPVLTPPPLPPANIPTLTETGLALLVLAFMLLLYRQLYRRGGRPFLSVLLVVLSGVVLAATPDGQLDEWAGQNPVGTDPTGDSGSPNTDLVAAFAAVLDGVLCFRLDIAELEDTAPAVTLAEAEKSDVFGDLATPPNEQDVDTDTDLRLSFSEDVTVTGNWAEVDCTVSGAQDVGGGGLAVTNTNPIYTLTPANVFINSETCTLTVFAVQVSDDDPIDPPDNMAADFVVSFTIVDNVAPIANDDPAAGNAALYTTLEDTQLTVSAADGVLANDTDADGGPNALTAVLDTDVSDGTLVLNADGSFTYDPDADFNGTDSFTYTVFDGLADSNIATVTLTITAVNDAPSFTVGPDQVVDEDAGAQSVAAWATAISAGPADEAGQTLTFNITANDNTALFSAGPAIAADGTLTYTPTADASGIANLTLELMDDGGTANGGVDTSAAQSFSITITTVDDPPVAVADSATVDEDDPATTIDVLGNDTDVDGGPISIASVTQPANGTAVITNAGADLTYQPNLDYCNDGTPTDDFTYTLNGGSTATVAVTVSCVDDAPVAVADSATVNEDAPATTLDVLGNDTDVDGGPISIASVTQPANGTVVNNGNNLTYTPDADFCNDGTPTDDFTYTLDPGGSTATVSVTVSCVDDAPVAVADSATVDEDDPATTIDVLGNDTDVDGGPISIDSVTQPANGTVVITNAGADLTYQPNLDYCNDGTPTDDFTYTLNGGSTATVAVTVSCVDDAPVAVADSATVNEDAPATTLDVLGNDTDVDSGPISIDSVTQPANGTVVNNGTDLSYEPDPDYCNDGAPTDDFSYTLTPGGSTATVAMTVSCVNDPPVLTLSGVPVQFDFITPVLIDPAATVTDIDSADFDTGNVVAEVTEASCEPGDLLSVNDQGVGVGQISVVGDDIFFDDPAVQIGTITTDYLCDPINGNNVLQIDLTADATPVAVQVLVQNLLFSTISPIVTDRSVEITVNDGDGGSSATQTQMVMLDAPPSVDNSTPADNDTDVAVDATITVTFSENVTVAGNWAEVDCTISGVQDVNAGLAVTDTDPTFTLNPATDFANGETCTLTVFATQVSDDDTIDPPDNMAADFVISFTTVDVAPQVTSTTPTANATVANTQTVELNFSESVDIASGGIVWDCGGAITFTPALPQTGVSSLTLTPGSALPDGAACTVTLESTLITDADGIDPPNELDGDNSNDSTDGDADDFSFGFTVDDPITVVSATPANNATGVAIDSNVVINFDELPTLNGGWFSIACTASNVTTANATITPAGNQVTIDPNNNFGNGEQCTVTIFSDATNGVTDADAGDPPDLLDGNNDGTTGDNHVFTFQTIDLAPTVNNAQVEVAGVLTNAPTSNVDADTIIVVNFSESVTASVGAFTIDNCTTSGDVSGQFSESTLPSTTATLTNTGADLFPGETCTLTVVAANISDNDGVPPANMAANFTTTFTIDSVLQITSVTVDTETAADQEADNGGSGPIDVNPNTDIDAMFNEAADGAGTWFTLVCDAAGIATAPTGFSNQTSVTETANLEPGESCTLTFASANLIDNDLSDPPNNLDGDEDGLEGGDKTVTFGVRPDAVTDTYNSIHTNVGLDVPQVNGVLTNDDRGDASPANIVGWGSTAGAAQSNTVAVGVEGATAQGGLATVNANGSFVYDPPPGFTGTDNFFYHLSNANGDHVGQVDLVVSGSRIWFINNNSPGSANRGTLQNPFTSLGSFNGSGNTQAGDFVHIEHHASPADYGGGLNLKNMMTVIGEGTSGNLSTYVITLGPISSLSFTLPTLGGSDPVIVNNAGNGISLAQNNTIRGLTVGNTSGVGMVDNGGTVGTLTVAETSITGNGKGLEANNGGTLAASFEQISSGNATGIDLAGVSGSFTVATGTIDAGTATAVNIDGNPSVDLGVTLTSASSSGGASVGINLVDTTGSFTVAGDGSNARNGSGGTITGKTGAGVLINRATNITLNSMNITNTGDDGVRLGGAAAGDFVTSFTMRGGLLSNNGNANGEHGIEMRDVHGTVLIDNTRVTNSNTDAIRHFNDSGTIASLTLTNSELDNAQNGAGFNFELQSGAGNPALTTGLVSGNNIHDIFATGPFFVNNGGGTMGAAGTPLVIQNNTVTDNNLGIDVSVGVQSGTSHYDVLNNLSILRHASHAMNFFSGDTAGDTSSNTINQRITGNDIGDGTAGSGSTTGTGIRANVSDPVDLDSLIDDNQLLNVKGRGIEAVGRLGGNGGDVDFTITNNTVVKDKGTPFFGDTFAGVFVSADGNPVCSNIRTNNVDGDICEDFGAGAGFVFLGCDFLLEEAVGSALSVESGPTDCGGPCSDATAHVLATNTAVNGNVRERDSAGNVTTGAAALVALGTCQVP